MCHIEPDNGVILWAPFSHGFSLCSSSMLEVVLLEQNESIKCWTRPAFFYMNRSRNPNSWWSGQTDYLYQAVERKVLRSCYFEDKSTVMGIKYFIFKRLLWSKIGRSKLPKQVSTTVIYICKTWLQGFLVLGTCNGSRTLIGTHTLLDSVKREIERSLTRAN
jgi:hypothetical protein